MHPASWPHWPLLPVKNKQTKDESGFPLLGVMVEGSATVYNVNVWDIPNVNNTNELPAHKQYATVLEAEHDGWEVD
jgi:hypothetical protein